MTQVAEYSEVVLAAPENVGMVCPHCGLEVSRAAWASQDTFETYCARCGEEFTAEDCEIRVDVNSAHLFDLETAKSIRWFHGTSMEDWAEQIVDRDNAIGEGNTLVHVGLETAARERIETQGMRSVEVTESYLYEVRLKPEVLMAEEVSEDENVWQVETGAMRCSFGATHSLIPAGGALRYLNRWEAPGTISLIVDATMLEVVSVTKVSNSARTLQLA